MAGVNVGEIIRRAPPEGKALFFIYILGLNVAAAALWGLIAGNLWPAVSHQGMAMSVQTLMNVFMVGSVITSVPAVAYYSTKAEQSYLLGLLGFLAPLIGCAILGLMAKNTLNYSYVASLASSGIIVAGLIGLAIVLGLIGGTLLGIAKAADRNERYALAQDAPDNKKDLEFSHRTTPAPLSLKDVSAQLSQLERRFLPEGETAANDAEQRAVFSPPL